MVVTAESVTLPCPASPRMQYIFTLKQLGCPTCAALVFTSTTNKGTFSNLRPNTKVGGNPPWCVPCKRTLPPLFHAVHTPCVTPHASTLPATPPAKLSFLCACTAPAPAVLCVSGWGDQQWDQD